MAVGDELSKLVHPAALGVAFAAQFGAILSVTFGTWTLMYLYSPSKSLRMRFPFLNNAYANVEYIIQRRIDALPSVIRNSNVLDWNRVVVSGAEAWILRKPLIPFTYPFSVAVGAYAGIKYYNWMYPSQDVDQESSDTSMDEDGKENFQENYENENAKTMQVNEHDDWDEENIMDNNVPIPWKE